MPTIADLPWLGAAPADLAEQCAALLAGEGGAPGATLQWLASHALDARQARRLERTLTRLRQADADVSPLSGLRLVALSNTTFEFTADHLTAAAIRHGVALEVVLPPFDQVMQQALDPQSETARAAPDAILLALDHRWYGLARPALDDPGAAIDAAVQRLAGLLDALKANTPRSVILCTAPIPPTPLFGNLDALAPASPRAMVTALNAAIVAMAGDRGALLFDVADLAARVGADRWFEPARYFAFKRAFASEFDAVYADQLGRLLGAARGKARKCLVLDLDNTLWGGVVGDDGVEGLVLGPGSARGESFLAVQQLAVDLKSRGIILAVSSKNDDAVARAAFEGHPEMALALSDLAVFQANWLDKASNLEAIAKTLNIGVDSLVLLDDNPAERAQTRAALPMVAVPELPDDPAWFAWTLAAAGYFEAVSFSDDDRLRAAAYRADAERAQVQATARDLGDYLTSLDMRLTAGPFDPAGRARIAQLINKTNQFNLTTRRYTEAQVAVFEADSQTITLQIRLADRFGDLGMIGVVIARVGEAADGVREACVDTWLMSCRVLGRKVEEAMLALLVEQASRAGAERIAAEYRPTAKNGMVDDLLDRLGFERVGSDAHGDRTYRLPLADAPAHDLPHQLVTTFAELSPMEPE